MFFYAAKITLKYGKKLFYLKKNWGSNREAAKRELAAFFVHFYLNTLDEAMLLCGLRKYAKDTARKYNSVPKLMVYNTALLSQSKIS